MIDVAATEVAVVLTVIGFAFAPPGFLVITTIAASYGAEQRMG